MEKTFLKGSLSILHKSKDTAEQFLSRMAIQFKTLDLELCNIDKDLALGNKVLSSDSDTD